MYREYTYAELAELPQSELDKLKKEKLDELAETNQKRWDTVGAIMFYQHEIRKSQS